MHSQQIGELRQGILDNHKDLLERCNEMINQVLDLAYQMEDKISSMEGDITLLKRANIGSFVTCKMSSGSFKHNVPELKQF